MSELSSGSTTTNTIVNPRIAIYTNILEYYTNTFTNEPALESNSLVDAYNIIDNEIIVDEYISDNNNERIYSPVDTDSVIYDNNSISETKSSVDQSIEPTDDSSVLVGDALIDDMYMSMAEIVESLTTDTLLLSNKISIIQQSISTIKTDIDTMLTVYTKDMSTVLEQIEDMKKKVNTIPDIQKQLLTTRNVLLQTINSSIKSAMEKMVAEEVRKQLIDYGTSPA